MAKETKVVNVESNEEQATMDFYAKFGWEVLTTQRVYNKDSHLESRNDGVYNVTTTTDFVRITFTRDKAMPFYREISDIENRYYNYPMPAKPKTFTGLVVLFSILTFFSLSTIVLSLSSEFLSFLLPIGIIAFILSLSMAIMFGVITSKRNKKYFAEWRAARKKQEAVLLELKKYDPDNYGKRVG